MIIRPITLKIDDKIWKKFILLKPKTRTINGTLTELIEQYIEGKK